MSEKEVYQNLIERFREWIFGLPDSEHLLPMLKLRFSPEEAELCANIPYLPHTVEQISERLNMPIKELEKKLNDLAKKGIITRVEGSRATHYALNDALFQYYRMPGWKGEDDEWNRKLAPLSNKYYLETYAEEFMGHPTKGLRALPVNETIKDTVKIMPYEDILKVIDNAKYYTVSTCACRHRHNLDSAFEPCKHETENCLHFDRLGKYIVQNGLGREITKEETLEILKRAAEAGLVHGVSTTIEQIDTLCNCCSCCCLFLEKAVNMSGMVPRGHQPSNYIREIDEEKCIGCGLCARRCPMNAIEHDKEQKKVIFSPERCIGCGVCVYKCPKDAIYLVHREGEEQDFPIDQREQVTRFLKERGHNPLEVFKKNM